MKNQTVPIVPVLNYDGNLLTVFGTSQAIKLINEENHKYLEMGIATYLKETTNCELLTCKASDRIRDVVEQLVKLKIAELAVVDDHGRVVGSITARSILEFLAVYPIENRNEIIGLLD